MSDRLEFANPFFGSEIVRSAMNCCYDDTLELFMIASPCDNVSEESLLN